MIRHPQCRYPHIRLRVTTSRPQTSNIPQMFVSEHGHKIQKGLKNDQRYTCTSPSFQCCFFLLLFPSPSLCLFRVQLMIPGLNPTTVPYVRCICVNWILIPANQYSKRWLNPGIKLWFIGSNDTEFTWVPNFIHYKEPQCVSYHFLKLCCIWIKSA